MNKYKIALIIIIALINTITPIAQAVRIETEKTIFSNDVVVISNIILKTVTMESGTNNVVDFSLANSVLVPQPLYSNSAVTLKNLYDVADSLVVVKLYGATNTHPIMTGNGSLWAEVPATWAITNALAAGTNYIGTFWLTNSTDRIRQGSYEARVYAQKISGNSAVYGQVQLCYTDDDGATTNDIGTLSSQTDEIVAGIKSYWMSSENKNTITGTVLYIGVKYFQIRSGGTAATVVTYGGTGYNTHLGTPGYGNLTGYATEAGLDAVADRTTALETDTNRVYNWSKYPAVQPVDGGGKAFTNIGSLQITGGGPTNGAVLVSTNNLGQTTYYNYHKIRVGTAGMGITSDGPKWLLLNTTPIQRVGAMTVESDAIIVARNAWYRIDGFFNLNYCTMDSTIVSSGVYINKSTLLQYNEYRLCAANSAIGHTFSLGASYLTNGSRINIYFYVQNFRADMTNFNYANNGGMISITEEP